MHSNYAVHFADNEGNKGTVPLANKTASGKVGH